MISSNKYIFFISSCFFFFISIFLAGQENRVKVELDSTDLVIGQQANLIMELQTLPGTKVQFPLVREMMDKKIEVLKEFPVDTVVENEMISYTKKLLLTSFDSGSYMIPSMPFIIRSDEDRDTLFSKTTSINVHTVNIHTGKSIRDIKDPFDAPVTFLEILFLVFLAFTVIGIIVLTYFILKNKKKNIPILNIIKRDVPPHEQALNDLDKLKKEKLWQQGRVKLYYTRITEIIRIYLEKRYHIHAMEQTSEEIIESLKLTGFQNNELIRLLKDTFEIADLVKFAKADPMPDENESVMLNMFAFVNQTKPVENFNSEKEKNIILNERSND
ncbi:MAG: hypothetical protein ACOCUL_04060 [Bacteroidota bacterium]